VPHMWSIPALVASSDLVAILPRTFATYLAPKFDLEPYEVPVKIPVQHIYMAWHSKMDGDPGHQWLREAMLATARERMGAPVAETPSNVTPFARPTGAGRKGK